MDWKRKDSNSYSHIVKDESIKEPENLRSSHADPIHSRLETQEQEQNKKQKSPEQAALKNVLDAYESGMLGLLETIETNPPEMMDFTGSVMQLNAMLKYMYQKGDKALNHMDILKLREHYAMAKEDGSALLALWAGGGQGSEIRELLSTKVRNLYDRIEKDKTALDSCDLSKKWTLNTLLTQIRTEPFSVDGAEISEYVGGGINQRLHVKKGGREFVFTETKPVPDKITVLQRAKEAAPESAAFYDRLGADQRMQIVFNSMYRSHKNVFAPLKETENITKEQRKAARNALSILLTNSHASDSVNLDELIASDRFLKGFDEAIEEINTAVHLENANSFAVIKQGRSLEKRNVAMTRVSELIGTQGLIAHSKLSSISQGGKVKNGVITEWAGGMQSGDVVRLQGVKWGDQNRLLKQFADLEALDYICGNVDRHSGNLMYQVENGKIVSVKGIDNDSSFGNIKGDSRFESTNMTNPGHILLMRESTAALILNLKKEELSFTLRELIDQDEIDDTWSRVCALQHQIRQSRKAKWSESADVSGGMLRILKDDSELWDKMSIDRLGEVSARSEDRSIYKRLADTFNLNEPQNGVTPIGKNACLEIPFEARKLTSFEIRTIPKKGRFSDNQLREAGSFAAFYDLGRRSRFDSSLYRSMGLKDITDCLYIGAVKLKDFLRKEYDFRYEYENPQKLAQFKAYLTCFAYKSKYPITHLHPQYDMQGKPELVLTDLKAVIHGENMEACAKRELWNEENDRTRNKRFSKFRQWIKVEDNLSDWEILEAPGAAQGQVRREPVPEVHIEQNREEIRQEEHEEHEPAEEELNAQIKEAKLSYIRETLSAEAVVSKDKIRSYARRISEAVGNDTSEDYIEFAFRFAQLFENLKMLQNGKVDEATMQVLRSQYGSILEQADKYLSGAPDNELEQARREMVREVSNAAGADLKVISEKTFLRNEEGEAVSMTLDDIYSAARNIHMSYRDQDVEHVGGNMSQRDVLEADMLKKDAPLKDVKYVFTERENEPTDYDNMAPSVDLIIRTFRGKYKERNSETEALHSFMDWLETDQGKAYFVNDFMGKDRMRSISRMLFRNMETEVDPNMEAKELITKLIKTSKGIAEDDNSAEKKKKKSKKPVYKLDDLIRLFLMDACMAWGSRDNMLGMNLSAKIDAGANKDKRNIAMSITAKYIGTDDVIAHSVGATVVKDGVEKQGTLMEWVEDGVSTAEMVQQIGNGDIREVMDEPEIIKQLSDIQVTDWICGNIDRHSGNIAFKKNEDGKYDRVIGIDNDASFGKLTTADVKFGVQSLASPEEIRVMKESTALRILAMERRDFFYLLGNTVTEGNPDNPGEKEAAWDRVEHLKELIMEGFKVKNTAVGSDAKKLDGSRITILSDKDEAWNSLKICDLAKLSNGFSLFGVVGKVMMTRIEEKPKYCETPATKEVRINGAIYGNKRQNDRLIEARESRGVNGIDSAIRLYRQIKESPQAEPDIGDFANCVRLFERMIAPLYTQAVDKGFRLGKLGTIVDYIYINGVPAVTFFQGQSGNRKVENYYAIRFADRILPNTDSPQTQARKALIMALLASGNSRITLVGIKPWPGGKKVNGKQYYLNMTDLNMVHNDLSDEPPADIAMNKDGNSAKMQEWRENRDETFNRIRTDFEEKAGMKGKLG